MYFADPVPPNNVEVAARGASRADEIAAGLCGDVRAELESAGITITQGRHFSTGIPEVLIAIGGNVAAHYIIKIIDAALKYSGPDAVIEIGQEGTGRVFRLPAEVKEARDYFVGRNLDIKV